MRIIAAALVLLVAAVAVSVGAPSARAAKPPEAPELRTAEQGVEEVSLGDQDCTGRAAADIPQSVQVETIAEPSGRDAVKLTRTTRRLPLEPVRLLPAHAEESVEIDVAPHARSGEGRRPSPRAPSGTRRPCGYSAFAYSPPPVKSTPT
jgi:hypothetical protein